MQEALIATLKVGVKQENYLSIKVIIRYKKIKQEKHRIN